MGNPYIYKTEAWLLEKLDELLQSRDGGSQTKVSIERGSDHQFKPVATSDSAFFLQQVQDALYLLNPEKYAQWAPPPNITRAAFNGC